MLQVPPLNYGTVTRKCCIFFAIEFAIQEVCIVCYGVKAVFLQISLFISKLESCHHPAVLRTEVMPCSINADSRSAFNIRNVNQKRPVWLEKWL